MSKQNIANQRVIDLINYLIENRIVESQVELSEKLGISKQYLNQIVKGKSRASKETYDYLKVHYSKEMNIIENTLKETSIEYKSQLRPFESEFMMIPLVHQRAQAGFSEYWGDREWLDELPTYAVIKRTDGNYVAFEVVGDSMEYDGDLSIREGDIAICRELSSHHWKNRLHLTKEFVIVMSHDGIMIKEIVHHNVSAAEITCHSYNPAYPDTVINLNDVVKLYHVKEITKKRR